MLLTASTVFNWGLLPRWGGWRPPATWQPSLRKFFLIVSGVTKMSVGLGWKWLSEERRKPTPFWDIRSKPLRISVVHLAAEVVLFGRSVKDTLSGPIPKAIVI